MASMDVVAASRKRRASETSNGNTTISSGTTKKKRSSFIADCELWVDLPDLPNDSKLLRYPIDTERLFAFCASSLELRCKAEYHPEMDLGIPIEAIDPDAYTFDTSRTSEIHPDDDLILSLAKDCIKADRATLARRREQYQQEFPVARWFRKPEIMSNSLFSSTSVKRDFDTPSRPYPKPTIFNPDSILLQIEESFVQHRSKIVHSTNPSLEPVSVLPIYPHEGLSGLSFSHVMFDRLKSVDQDALLLSPSQSRFQDYYVRDRDADLFRWSARYMQTLSDIAPDSKDRLFFLLTPSAALYGDLSSRQSIQKVLTIDSLSEDERQKIPSTIILNDGS